MRAAHVTGWPSWVRRAPRSHGKGAKRPFWYISERRKDTYLPRQDCHLAGGTCRPGLHGPRCARLTSILGLFGAVEHACGASRMSFVDPRRSPVRALGLAMHARSRESAPRAKRAPSNSSPRVQGAVPADLDVLWCLVRAIEAARPRRPRSGR